MCIRDSGDTATFTVGVTATNTTDFITGVPDYTGASAVNVSGTTTYQWFLGDPRTGAASLLIGETNPTLTRIGSPTTNGNQYCVEITHPDNVCIAIVECATLTSNPPLPPVADDDTAMGTINTAVPVDALAGDDDPDGDNTLLAITEIDGTPISVCLLYTSPSPRDRTRSRMPSSA